MDKETLRRVTVEVGVLTDAAKSLIDILNEYGREDAKDLVIPMYEILPYIASLGVQVAMASCDTGEAVDGMSPE